MHFLVRDDGGDRIERSHNAEHAIVIEPKIAILRAGILPGYHEDREALLRQVADQRVLRRQIENVIFHDPGRYDQHRRRPHLIGCGSVLDKFDQPVTKDDLAWRHRHVPTYYEVLGADRPLTGEGALPVFDQVVPAAHQIGATSGE